MSSNLNGWHVSVYDRKTHVVPVCDLRLHEPVNCWCNPVVELDEPFTLIHNSLDGREAFERGERQQS